MSQKKRNQKEIKHHLLNLLKCIVIELCKSLKSLCYKSSWNSLDLSSRQATVSLNFSFAYHKLGGREFHFTSNEIKRAAATVKMSDLKNEERPLSMDELDAGADNVLNINHGFGPIPEKRKKRATRLSVALSLVIIIVLLGGFTQSNYNLYVVESNNTTDDGLICKRDDRGYYHVGVFIWSLNFIGVILGEFMNRFCLMFEEYFHLDSRYSGSKKKMFYACFSDISLRAVLFGTLIAFVIITTTLLSQGTHYFKFEYIEIILSGVGSGSLVLYLLSVDAPSKLQISSLMENNNHLVANGLAWSYYFGYLNKILPKLRELIEKYEWENELSSKKLYILVPRDSYVFGLISWEDENIKKTDAEIEYEHNYAGVKKVNRLNVYSVQQTNKHGTLYVLAQYASPLCRLHEMHHSANTKLYREELDDQVKLFFRTLEAILKNPSVSEVRNKCKLVPYARTKKIRLSEVLAEAILEDMQDCDTHSEISLDDIDSRRRLTKLNSTEV